jgi:hypothetical protein
MKPATKVILRATLAADDTLTDDEKASAEQLLEGGSASKRPPEGPLLSISAAAKTIGVSRPTLRIILADLSADPKTPNHLLPQKISPTRSRISLELIHHLKNGRGVRYGQRESLAA